MLPLHFSLRSLALALALTSLGACSLLIPENPSAPRYNSVMGAPRSPALNNTVDSKPSTGPSSQHQYQSQPAFETAPPMQQSSRQVPYENAPVDMAQSGYPDLRRVPANPPAGEAQRMYEIRNQLETDRNAANADSRRLLNDAAQEPSLVPPPDPISVSPIPSANPAPISPQSSFAPPPGGMEPITLRAPSVTASSATAPSFTYAAPSSPPPAYTPQTMAPAMAGGFNPMEGSGAISVRAPTGYASSGQYLPPSRYVNHRN